MAIIYRNYELLASILSTDKGKQDAIVQRDKYGNTIFHLIARINDVQCLSIMSQNKIAFEVNVQNDKGETPLDIAEMYHHHEFLNQIKKMDSFTS